MLMLLTISLGLSSMSQTWFIAHTTDGALRPNTQRTTPSAPVMGFSFLFFHASAWVVRGHFLGEQ
jgi:hypothetical protein